MFLKISMKIHYHIKCTSNKDFTQVLSVIHEQKIAQEHINQTPIRNAESIYGLLSN